MNQVNNSNTTIEYSYQYQKILESIEMKWSVWYLFNPDQETWHMTG